MFYLSAWMLIAKKSNELKKMTDSVIFKKIYKRNEGEANHQKITAFYGHLHTLSSAFFQSLSHNVFSFVHYFKTFMDFI